MSICYGPLDAGPATPPVPHMDSEKPPTAAKPPPKTGREVRLEREAAALRANLRKRKEQARVREQDGERGQGVPDLLAKPADAS